MRLPFSLPMDKGLSSQEYMLGIGLVGVSAIAALVFFGNMASDTFSGLSTGLPATKQPGKFNSATLLDTSKGNNISLTSQPGNVVNSGDINAFSNRTDLSSSMTNAIETSGANGATEALLASFKAQIPQLLENKTITQEEANSLNKLANLGHQMADIEALVEKAVSTSKQDVNTLKSATFTYNNQAYDLEGMLSEIQMVQTSQSPFVPLLDNSVAGQFYSLRNELSKTVQDPNTRQLVSALGTNILLIGDGVENAANYMQHGKIKMTGDYRQTIIDNTSIAGMEPLPSAATDSYSASICKAGSSKDNGKKCR